MKYNKIYNNVINNATTDYISIEIEKKIFLDIDYYFKSSSIFVMTGKKFLIILLSFLFCFAFTLYMYMYFTGWFDIFLDSGFKGLYGDKS